MRGDPVPDPDHILRYVRPGFVQDGLDGEEVLLGGGFISRPRDENNASYNWLEVLEGTLEERVQQVRTAARMGYGAKGRLARLNVGQVRQLIKDEAEGREVTVIHDPLESEERYPLPDPSHALVTNIPDENDPQGELIGDLIRQCILDVFPARPT